MNSSTINTETPNNSPDAPSESLVSSQDYASAALQDERYLAPLEKFYRRFSSPIKEFVQKQTFGSAILLCSVITAMILANSEFSDVYARLLHLPIGIKISSSVLETSLHHLSTMG